MVRLPEAASEWSKGAPDKSPVRSPLQPGSVQLQPENLTVPAENGNVNNCPVQIKVCRDESGDDIIKQPSYLSLARCISGYTLLTTYDSKQREGFRSRDISPVRVPLPIGMNPPYQPTRTISNISSSSSSSSSGGGSTTTFTSTITNSYSTVDSGSTCHGMTTMSTATYTKGCSDDRLKLNGSPLASVANSSFVSALPFPIDKTSNNMLSARCGDIESKTASTGQQTEKSFVLQRVERLYGPGALAQGFYARRSLNRKSLNSNDELSSSGIGSSIKSSSSSIRNGNCDSNVNKIESQLEDALPVLKLLRPEFRAQLSVSVAKHKIRSSNVDETDGTSFHTPCRERIIPIQLKDNEDAVEKHVIPEIIEDKHEQHLSAVQQRDGHYYLKVVRNEMASLQRLADDLQSEMTSTIIPDELEGELRSVIGKARLLVNEKLRQFEGLCHKNICQDLSDNFCTTNEDLAGFWDMVFIQVENIYKEFNNIAKLRKNGWKFNSAGSVPQTLPKNEMVDKPGRKDKNLSTALNASNKNGSKCVISSLNSKPNRTPANNARDEARRKMLLERKMAMKKSLSDAANQDQVFIS